MNTGTKGGEERIPESLGLAPGVVFLVCIILFQQLHCYDVASVLHWAQGGGKDGALKQEPPAGTSSAAGRLPAACVLPGALQHAEGSELITSRCPCPAALFSVQGQLEQLSYHSLSADTIQLGVLPETDALQGSC